MGVTRAPSHFRTVGRGSEDRVSRGTREFGEFVRRKIDAFALSGCKAMTGVPNHDR